MKFSGNNTNGTKMSKAFWEGFREGFRKRIWLGIAFAIGIAVGNYAHPYETCPLTLEELQARKVPPAPAKEPREPDAFRDPRDAAGEVPF